MLDHNYVLNVFYLFVFCCVNLLGVARLFWCDGAISSVVAEWREQFDEGKTLNRNLSVSKNRADLCVEVKGFKQFRNVFHVIFVKLICIFQYLQIT